MFSLSEYLRPLQERVSTRLEILGSRKDREACDAVLSLIPSSERLKKGLFRALLCEVTFSPPLFLGLFQHALLIEEWVLIVVVVAVGLRAKEA